jgi:hypothetical protein
VRWRCGMSRVGSHPLLSSICQNADFLPSKPINKIGEILKEPLQQVVEMSHSAPQRRLAKAKAKAARLRGVVERVADMRRDILLAARQRVWSNSLIESPSDVFVGGGRLDQWFGDAEVRHEGLRLDPINMLLR